jgi:MFS family permease
MGEDTTSPSLAEKTKLRRLGIRCLYGNAVVWGLGNGLVSSSLVVYLASFYGAKGLAISLILAAPRLIGVLRLATPLLMSWIGNRRRFTVICFLASAGFLLALPLVSAPKVLPSPEASLAAVVLLWSCYHFCEFLGTIALWSWIGDLVPRRIRGRFVGKRSGIMNAGQVTGMVLGAAITWYWQEHATRQGHSEQAWLGYVICVVSGAALFGLATLPLLRVPNVRSVVAIQQPHMRDIFTPFFDRAFLRYLIYGGWFSLANGITGAAQALFQIRVLNISYAQRIGLDGTSQGIQSVIMPWIGRVIDRRGNVPVLVVSQLLVAGGLLFFVIATPEYRWWIAGAYAMWIAYAGINVAMPNLVLNLTKREIYASYVAVWFAWTQLVYALSTVAGGLLFDWASQQAAYSSIFGEIDHFAAIFLLGFVLRLIAAGLAARVSEPRNRVSLDHNA